ncbi:MAG: phosphoribosylglycinamide formyltransferase [Spirochaetales bacterium]|nr:phosphoribosylglycinamide formyltransferase [Spirochaetales bacterium]
MARLAVFASGSGSNFEAIALALKSTRHTLEFLLCDRRQAFALERARRLGVPARLVSYKDRTKEDVEREMLEHCADRNVDCIALAGFMRLLTPYFLNAFGKDILNLHPALLPKFPGVDAIRRSVEAGEKELGISIITVDSGCDTGPILFQDSFARPENASLDELTERIHSLEHRHYPRVVIETLDKIDAAGGTA